MRETKFRGWHKTEKYMTRPLTLFNIQRESGRCLADYEWLDFTGLKDKQGKEIYEGDIVKGKRFSPTKTYTVIGSVEYNDVRTCFDIIGSGFRDYLWNLKENIEVIGNIYENKELLNDRVY